MEPEGGQILALTHPDGRQIPARVDRMDDETVFFDLNHPLAGESLTFALQVLGISETAVQPNHGCGCSSSSDGCGCGDSGCD
jgi:peptidylprolyl isomerase